MALSLTRRAGADEVNLEPGWLKEDIEKAAARFAPDDAKPPVEPMPKARLATNSAARKAQPVFSGVLRYFPDALAEVAKLSLVGNEKHNPGQPLHWSRGKSVDELDALTRHLLECGTLDTDGIYHDVKVAWRALANLQKLLERERGLPVSPGSR